MDYMLSKLVRRVKPDPSRPGDLGGYKTLGYYSPILPRRGTSTDQSQYVRRMDAFGRALKFPGGDGSKRYHLRKCTQSCQHHGPASRSGKQYHPSDCGPNCVNPDCAYRVLEPDTQAHCETQSSSASVRSGATSSTLYSATEDINRSEPRLKDSRHFVGVERSVNAGSAQSLCSHQSVTGSLHSGRTRANSPPGSTRASVRGTRRSAGARSSPYLPNIAGSLHSGNRQANSPSGRARVSARGVGHLVDAESSPYSHMIADSLRSGSTRADSQSESTRASIRGAGHSVDEGSSPYSHMVADPLHSGSARADLPSEGTLASVRGSEHSVDAGSSLYLRKVTGALNPESARADSPPESKRAGVRGAGRSVDVRSSLYLRMVPGSLLPGNTRADSPSGRTRGSERPGALARSPNTTELSRAPVSCLRSTPEEIRRRPAPEPTNIPRGAQLA